MKTLAFALFAATVISCSSADNCLEDVSKENFSITVTKGACMGLCPVYDGTINGDASVYYEGRVNTELMGTYTAQVPTDTLCKIITLVLENEVMKVDTNYMQPIQDAPASTMTVKYNGVLRRFSWNLSTPKPLKELHDVVVRNTHENADLKPVQSSN